MSELRELFVKFIIVSCVSIIIIAVGFFVWECVKFGF